MKPLELDHPLRNNPVLWLIWVLLGSAVYAGCLLAFGFRPRDFSRRAAA